MTTQFLTWAVAAGLGLVFFTVSPISARAEAVQSGPQTPEAAGSQPGNYLAALIASADRDTSSAESYFREALRVDPRNADLIERAFASALANGDEQGANALGERLLARDPSNGLARLATAVHAIAQGQFAAARAQLASADARSRDVTAAFLTAWCYAGQMDLHRALDSLDRIRDPSVAGFRDFHAGLISDYLGSATEARRRFKAAYESDKNTLRFVDAYARFLAAHGDPDGAKTVYADFSAAVPITPL